MNFMGIHHQDHIGMEGQSSIDIGWGDAFKKFVRARNTSLFNASRR
jgi:hypothetical protein